jgi:hypothetical protein
MGSRRKYHLLGVATGLLIAAAVFALRRPHHWDSAIIWAVTFCMNCGIIAVSIAERKGKVKPIDRRPLTLFPRDPA